jgi:hypothetical protein
MVLKKLAIYFTFLAHWNALARPYQDLSVSTIPSDHLREGGNDLVCRIQGSRSLLVG